MAAVILDINVFTYVQQLITFDEETLNESCLNLQFKYIDCKRRHLKWNLQPAYLQSTYEL